MSPSRVRQRCAVMIQRTVTMTVMTRPAMTQLTRPFQSTCCTGTEPDTSVTDINVQNQSDTKLNEQKPLYDIGCYLSEVVCLEVTCQLQDRESPQVKDYQTAAVVAVVSMHIALFQVQFRCTKRVVIPPPYNPPQTASDVQHPSFN